MPNRPIEGDSAQSLFSRRSAAQWIAGACGVALLQRAASRSRHSEALADDEDDDSGHGRGRGRGRGGRDDNSGPGHGDDDEDHDDEGDDTIVPVGEIPEGSVEIRIVSDDAGGFVPGDVTLDAGQTITFVNTHDDEHTATGSGFDTGIIGEGGVITITMTEPGSFPYACQIHPEMTGIVHVRDADGAIPARQGTPIPDSAVRNSIADLSFKPADQAAQTGDMVVWTNDDSVPHTVTAADGQFDSGIIDPGSSFSWTFGEPGMFAYACALHPTMQGSISVDDQSPAGATPEASPTSANGARNN